MTTDERVRDGLAALADEVTTSPDLFAAIEAKRLQHDRARRNRRVLVSAAAAVAVLVAASVWMLQGGGSEHGARVATQPGETSKPAASSIPSTTAAAVDASSDLVHGLGAVQIADLTWISATHGWALAVLPTCDGDCAVVLTTEDGGDNWQMAGVVGACISGSAQCPQGDATVSGIRFANADVGYLFGPDLFVTTDGGRTWVAQPGRAVNAIEIAGNNAIRISSTHTGCPGPCDWSIDRAPVGTNNWSALPTPAITFGVGAQLVRQGTTDVYAAFFGNPAGGAGSAHAQLYVSHDGGDSWSSRTDPCDVAGQFEYDLLSFAAAPGSVAAALCQARLSAPGSPPYVAVSSDGAGTFSPPHLVPPEVAPVARIAILSSSDVIVTSGQTAGSGAFQYKVAVSHDAGLSWAIPVTDNERLDGLVTTAGFLGFENPTTGRWVGYPGTIWTTTDGGDHWTAHTFG